MNKSHIKKLIRKNLNERETFDLIETPLAEDYPTSFDREHFKTLKSFNKRIAYCEENLQRISSGSSRIVYQIDNEKVLKLAKNKKGIAQNETEIEWGGDSHYEDILAHVFDSDPNNLWVEMELARKVNRKTFEQVLGYDLESFATYLKYFDYTNIRRDAGQSEMFKRMLTNADVEAGEPGFEFFTEDEFANGITGFMYNTDTPNGDYVRLSSYGLVKRNGKDDIVLIDFGLTGDIYDNYYS